MRRRAVAETLTGGLRGDYRIPSARLRTQGSIHCNMSFPFLFFPRKWNLGPSLPMQKRDLGKHKEDSSTSRLHLHLRLHFSSSSSSPIPSSLIALQIPARKVQVPIDVTLGPRA